MMVMERDWRAEEDARNLARAMEIAADKDRYEKAVSAAKLLVSESQEKADSMKKVAGIKTKDNTLDSLNKQLKGEVRELTRRKR